MEEEYGDEECKKFKAKELTDFSNVHIVFDIWIIKLNIIIISFINYNSYQRLRHSYSEYYEKFGI